MAGIRSAEVREIQRQKGKYKAAIKALSQGKAALGFDRLDALGWIEELPGGDREQKLAADYVASVNSGASALVVSPTHAEGQRITAAIRDRLRSTGGLGGAQHEREFLRLDNRNLTEAQRGESSSYAPNAGDVLVFHQNAKGAQRGAKIAVTAANLATLPLETPARFQAYRASSIALAPGETIKITANGYTADRKHRLNNGALYRIQDFDAQGNIVLNNGWVVSQDYGHLAHGYVVTSHAAQGKTVDHVYIGQSAASLGATSREQFYVSASRQEERADLHQRQRRP